MQIWILDVCRNQRKIETPEEKLSKQVTGVEVMLDEQYFLMVEKTEQVLRVNKEQENILIEPSVSWTKERQDNVYLNELVHAKDVEKQRDRRASVAVRS